MAGEIGVKARGFLGGDVQVVTARSGREVAEFSLAVSVRRKDGDEWKDVRTDWVRCSAWGNLIGAVRGLTKGTLVEVEGRLTPDAYLSKNGEAVAATRVTVDKLFIVPRAPKGVSADVPLAQPAVAGAGTPF